MLVLILGNREEEKENVEGPWVSIFKNLLPDLFSSVEHVKNQMNQDHHMKPKLVARIGKVIFHG